LWRESRCVASRCACAFLHITPLSSPITKTPSFDNAEAYESGKAEEVMGAALKDLAWPRSSYVLSTKIYWGGPGPNDTGLSRKHILEGTRACLDRLGVEYVDLLFAHRPDPETPMEETVRAFNACLDKGWALYWGTSEWSAAELADAWRVADRLGLVGPAFEQPQYNLLERKRVEVEYGPLYESVGLGLTTWSPLASGVLTGKYGGGVPAGSRLADPKYAAMLKDKLDPAILAKVDKLAPIAKGLGCSLAQLGVAWAAANPHVSTVILGASKPDQLADNLGALAVVPKLTPEVLARIEAVMETKPEPVQKWR
jgi:voltage-dependent potassium channel beta subunit